MADNFFDRPREMAKDSRYWYRRRDVDDDFYRRRFDASPSSRFQRLQHFPDQGGAGSWTIRKPPT